MNQQAILAEHMVRIISMETNVIRCMECSESSTDNFCYAPVYDIVLCTYHLINSDSKHIIKDFTHC
jgi:hypothetical protein